MKKFLTIFLFSFLIGQPSLAAISVGSTVTSARGQAVSTLTYSHTINSGTTVLVVPISALNGPIVDPVVSSVTWNGTALTQINSAINGNRMASLWYLGNPSSGTHNIVITMSSGATTDIEGGALNLIGADGSDPIDTDTSHTSANTNLHGQIITNNAGSMLIDAFATAFAGGATVGSGQTAIYNINADNRVGASYKLSTTAGEYFMDWTFDGSTGDTAQSLVAINALAEEAPPAATSTNPFLTGSTTVATDGQNLHYLVGLGSIAMIFLITDIFRRTTAGLTR